MTPEERYTRAKIYFNRYHERFGKGRGIIGFAFTTREKLDFVVGRGAEWMEVDDAELAECIRATWKERPDFCCNPSVENTVFVILPYV